MVVDYQVVVDKDLPNPGHSIVAAIKNESNGGQFGEFMVDLSSISADGKFVVEVVELMKDQLFCVQFTTPLYTTTPFGNRFLGILHCYIRVW